MYSQLILSLLFGVTSLCSPIGDSYTISLPTHIDLSNSGSFNVELVNSSIGENDSINIVFDSDFTLSDIHGKDDIHGSLTNNVIEFSYNKINMQTVNYQINNPSVGEWAGNLNARISFNRKAEGNILIDGASINNILKTINPSIITFSHADISDNYLYDLSTAQDKSILLGQNGNEVIISNLSDKPIKANENMSSLFKDLSVSEINNLNYIDMSYCTDASKMFQNCSGIVCLDVTGMDTSNVTNMSHMFDHLAVCTTITGMESFDVSNVENLSYLLNNNTTLTSVPDLSNWDVTSKCTDISYIMYNVGYQKSVAQTSVWPTYLDLTHWDVSGVSNMSHAFMNAFNLTTLDISGWNTGSVTNMSNMFEMTDNANNSNLVSIIGIDSLDVRELENMSRMFYNCKVLANADFSNWQLQSISNVSNAFYNTKMLDLTVFENWGNYIINNGANMKNCFGGSSGTGVNKTYKPSWYQ